MAQEHFIAATRLRKAVHVLAQRIIKLDIEADQLNDVAETIEKSTESLSGKDVSRWWGKTSDDGETRSRSYRSRSLFQGELHIFSPELVWGDFVGPGGEPGYEFSVNLSDLYQGPPLAVHGGYTAGLFDELLGAVQSLDSGATGYTAKLNIKYRAFTPINKDLRFQGWIVKSSGRRITVKGHCLDGNRVCSEVEALFLRPKKSEPVDNG